MFKTLYHVFSGHTYDNDEKERESDSDGDQNEIRGEKKGRKFVGDFVAIHRGQSGCKNGDILCTDY